MILDTSALIAIFEAEPECADFENLISRHVCRMSAAGYLETSIVLLHKRGEAALLAFDTWLEAADVTIVALDRELARLARDAYMTFGKGRHAAGLNFGDCASYALSVATGEPLLFKGNDFAKTDVPRIGDAV